MLRLVFLAGISLMSGCSCESLWGRYEVPCTRGFDCPDGAMPGGEIDMRTSSNEDGGTPDDGPPTSGDMRRDDMLPPIGDMRFEPPELGMMDMRIIVIGDDLGLAK